MSIGRSNYPHLALFLAICSVLYQHSNAFAEAPATLREAAIKAAATLSACACSGEAHEMAKTRIKQAGKLVLPKRLTAPKVEWPTDKRGPVTKEGEVKVRVLIDETGTVKCADIWSSTIDDTRFKAAAVQAAMKCTYEPPHSENGTPSYCYMLIPFEYKLK